MTTWNDLPFFESDGFNKLCDELERQRESKYSILPAEEDVLNAFNYTPFDQVKVVILGQDPYPNSAHAHGLAFSVPEGVHPFPASLRNIFKELQDDLGCPKPTSGCLIPWAKQGVLLLNTSLTVLEGSPGSHANLGWMLLINDAIKKLSQEHDSLVFILWGKNAQTKSIYIDRRKHLIIRGAHPSPLAANRGGFFGTKPFSQASVFLYENGKETIDWHLD